MTPLPFLAALAMADNAAQILAKYRTAPKAGEPDFDLNLRVRAMLRGNSVTALRYLWETGDAGQRATVAARVGIWMKTERVITGDMRIYAREKARGL